MQTETTIDIDSERLLSLKDAAAYLPANRGRRLHHSTIWRWCNRGLRGVRLESVKIGGTAFTSVEALSRFIARLTADDAAPSPASRTREHERAKRELEQAGI